MRTMVYHPDGDDIIWGIKCQFQIVDSEEADKLKAKRGKNKWYSSPLEFPGVEDGTESKD